MYLDAGLYVLLCYTISMCVWMCALAVCINWHGISTWRRHFISNFCLLFSALFLLRIMFLSLHSNVVFVVDLYDCCLLCVIAWLFCCLMPHQNSIFCGGADRWIMCCCSFVCHERLLVCICVTCSYFFIDCLLSWVSKKWLGRHNVTIAIDLITCKKVSNRVSIQKQ